MNKGLKLLLSNSRENLQGIMIGTSVVIMTGALILNLFRSGSDQKKPKEEKVKKQVKKHTHIKKPVR